MKKALMIAILFVSALTFAQDSEIKKDSILSALDTIQYKNDTILKKDNLVFTGIDTLRIDSLAALGKKIAFIDYTYASEIDKKWMESWKNSSIKDSTSLVLEMSTIESLEDIVIEDLPTELLKERLNSLNQQTPFNVEYNPSLERVIKHYLKNRKQTLGDLMGRAKYYFPMFEEHLDKYDIPIEIKYLAIVESALKPTANSRVGAKGLWQFMYSTGKEHDLTVSSYVDERFDPLKATDAACQYLLRLYNIFDDWDLALAAYNSGPGNVSKAIRRSGGKRNYWNIRHYLPRETAGYLPAFYATYYIMEYADEHNLKPTNELVDLFETDTVHVKRQLTFDQINRVVQTDEELLTFLNPQYKLKIIPYIPKRNYTLRLPKFMMGRFVANEALIYAYAEADDKLREKPLPKYFESGDRIRYRVKSGDYLGKIARKYGVSVSSIKRWNGLKNNNLRVGQRLTIYPRNAGAPVASASSSSKTSSPSKKPSGNYKTYVVQKGDSLWLIAKKFPQVTVKQIQSWNDIWSTKNLKPGTKLKIY